MTAPASIANEIFGQLPGGSIAGETAAYVAVPGDATARWLVPAHSPEISPVLAGWGPYRLGARAAWAALRAANRMGWAAGLPGTSLVVADANRNTDWGALGWRWSGEPIPVTYLGTPGPGRKAVIHLVERGSGTCRAVVKVPLAEGAKAAILREADTLEALAAEGYESSPRLLHVDWVKGISTQAFVEGRHGERKLTLDTWRLLRSLRRAAEYTSLAEHTEDWEREIATEIGNPAGRETLLAIVDQLRDDTPLPRCWEHGDFAPWNIKRQAGGECALIDWEEARRPGLPMVDAFHFLHTQDFLFGGRAKIHAADVAGEGPVMGVSGAHCRKLEAAYLISAYLTCVRRQNSERARFVGETLTLWRRRVA